MTVNKNDPNQLNQFRPPSPGMDPELQRELDEALGDMSLEDLIEQEEKGRTAAPSATPGARAEKGAGVRRGRVVSIQGDDIFVDMGGKSQGVLPMLQFEGSEAPSVGDMIEVTIEGYNPAEGLLNLSRQGAITAAAWDTLSEGQVVEARVTDQNKGGLEVTINGIRGFMPISQVEMFRVEDLKEYVNQKLRCQVTEVDREEHNVIVSRRALLELEVAEARDKAWETLAEGQVLEGHVRNVMPYGAFVDVGGIDGLLHVSDMSWSRVNDPNTVVKPGEKIQVKVLKIDREARKVSLGLKQCMPDPWTGAAGRWPPGATIEGKVTRLADFGAFVELAPGVEGLVPLGEMSFARRVNKADEIVQLGQMIRVKVLTVEEDRKRVSLSIKRAGDDPWTGAAIRWPAGNIVDGKVTRTADFGAFIELTPGVEGLVHISELSRDRVRSVADAVQVGQAVSVKVLDVQEDARRISLSIKQAQESPQYTGPVAAKAAGPTVEGAAPAAEEPPPPPAKRKSKKPLKGGLE
jgi:small subunit ribosomal protein S1